MCRKLQKELNKMNDFNTRKGTKPSGKEISKQVKYQLYSLNNCCFGWSKILGREYFMQPEWDY